MPGLVGIVTKMPKEWAEAQLAQMLKAVCHESFYKTGTWGNTAQGVYVGWVAREGSTSEGMPVCNEAGNVSLIFSGEEYPAPSTLQRLKSQGHSFNPKDSSYLVHAYEEDVDFLPAVNGRFHGLISDSGKGNSLLFNDRYGMHRLYYHEAKDAFYFAAEAKAILAVRPELRRIDPVGLGEFVSCSCTLEHRSIFDGIQLMPSAAAWTFRNGAVENKKTYFDTREWEQQQPLDDEAYYEQLRSVLVENLPRYFDGSERMGISLTGGLDTRVILGLHQPAPGSLPCYTFGGIYRESQDVKIARRVASQQKQPFQVIELGKQFLEQFPRYVERSMYLTEGCIDASRSADLYVSEKARHIASAKIVGTYGSEIIRQGIMFKPTPPLAGLYRPEFLQHVTNAAGTYAKLRREHPATFAAFLQSPRYHFGVLALEQSQLTVRSPYLDNDFVRVAYRAPALSDDKKDVRLRLIRSGDRGLADMPTDLGFGGRRNGVVATLNQKMQWFTFKAEYAYDYGMPRRLVQFDHAFSWMHFEKLFLGRHKFYHFRVWYRDALSKYIQEILLDQRTLSRPYLDAKVLRAMVNGHTNGTENHTATIHKILGVELLHRAFVD
jgi:asparagine synthase (glutamine-hydrolysing)